MLSSSNHHAGPSQRLFDYLEKPMLLVNNPAYTLSKHIMISHGSRRPCMQHRHGSTVVQYWQTAAALPHGPAGLIIYDRAVFSLPAVGRNLASHEAHEGC